MMPKFNVDIPMPPLAVLPPRTILHSRWAFGDKVTIDGDTSLVGVVTGIWWTAADRETVEVSWIHNGTAQSSWFHPYRLDLSGGH